MPCGVCSPRRDCSKILAIPLAPFSLVVAIVLLGYRGWTVYGLMNDPTWPNAALWVSFAMIVLQLVIVGLGTIAVLMRWVKGIQLLILGMRFVVIAFILAFIIDWVYWILRMNGVANDDVKWEPSGSEIAEMAIHTAVAVIFVAGAYWIFCGLYSLAMVVAAGGSGWEGRNYLEVRSGGGKNTIQSTTSLSSL